MTNVMKIVLGIAIAVALLSVPARAQDRRLWVLRTPGEMVEYDLTTWAAKPPIKLPVEALHSPQSVAVNRSGQILFAPVVTLPLADNDITAPHKAWLWNGHSAVSIDLGVKHETSASGSNQVVTESAPTVYLSADGAHLFWFANQQRRLQREDVDLSVTTTWQAWQSDLTGAAREDLASTKMPECRCTTGACEENCPAGVTWGPDGGVADFFVMTEYFVGQTEATYKATTLYHQTGGKWTSSPATEPLRRVLDAADSGNMIVEALPDTGCCGWSNQSNDQTLVIAGDKTQTIFDERATYKNADYDVSFYTSDARLAPAHDSVAMTITATATANQPIQLAEEGQANPEESKQIHKSLAELPAVEVKSLGDSPRRLAFLPHATLVGWINEKEILIVEDRFLVIYSVTSGARRKSSVRVEDAARVFLR